MINPLEATVWAVISPLISHTLSFQLLFKDREEYETGLDGHVMNIAFISVESIAGSHNSTVTIMAKGKDITGYHDLLIDTICALNMSYYKALTYASKVFQTLFLEHDGLKKSNEYFRKTTLASQHYKVLVWLDCVNVIVLLLFIAYRIQLLYFGN